MNTAVGQVLTKVRRLFVEKSWFSGLYDDKFNTDKTPQSTTFQKVEPYIRDTEQTIDT